MSIIKAALRYFSKSNADDPLLFEDEQIHTAVYHNEDILYIESHIGSPSIPDPEGIKYYLTPKVNDMELGEALINSLARRRTLSNEAHSALMNDGMERRKEWLKELTVKYGYRNELAALKNTLQCGVSFRNNNIIISPMDHIALQMWSGINHLDDIIVSGVNSSDVIGRALREGLRLCTDSYGSTKQSSSGKAFAPPDLSRSAPTQEDHLLELLCDGDRRNVEIVKQFFEQADDANWYGLSTALAKVNHGVAEDDKRAPYNFFVRAKLVAQQIGLGDFEQSDLDAMAEEPPPIHQQIERFSQWLRPFGYQILHLVINDGDWEIVVVQIRYVQEIIKLAHDCKGLIIVETLESD